MNSLSVYIRSENNLTSQPVDCEIAGYYVTADDECHEVLSPRNITCSGSVHDLGFMHHTKDFQKRDQV